MDIRSDLGEIGFPVVGVVSARYGQLITRLAHFRDLRPETERGERAESAMPGWFETWQQPEQVRD